MAYSNGYVLSLISNDSPIKEYNKHGARVVYLPFQTEYKLRLKNKTNKGAMAKVFIDGKSISGDRYFVLDPGATFDIERYLADSMQSGSRFKFVPVDHPSVDDPTEEDNGLVTVKFYPQKDTFTWTTTAAFPDNYVWEVDMSNMWKNSSTVQPETTFCTDSMSSLGGTRSCSVNNIADLTGGLSFSSSGATVEGSKSNQKFQASSGYDIDMDNPTTLSLRILGARANVERKIYCAICGRKRSRTSDNYCSKCGTKY